MSTFKGPTTSLKINFGYKLEGGSCAIPFGRPTLLGFQQHISESDSCKGCL